MFSLSHSKAIKIFFQRNRLGGRYVYFVYDLLKESVRIADWSAYISVLKVIVNSEFKGVWKKVIMATF